MGLGENTLPEPIDLPKGAAIEKGSDNPTEGQESQGEASEALEKVEAKLEKSGVDIAKFEAYIKTLSEGGDTAQLSAMIQLIESTSFLKIKLYNKRNGFIINNDTRLAFEQRFGKTSQELTNERNKKVEQELSETQEVEKQVLEKESEAEQEVSETQEEVSETQEVAEKVVEKVSKGEEEVSKAEEEVSKAEEKVSERQEEQKKAKDFVALFSPAEDFQGIANIEHILSSLDVAISEGTDTSDIDLSGVEAFFQQLESNPESFSKVAHIFEKRSPEKYQEYKSYALSQNPDLAAQFTRYEQLRSINSPTPESELHQAQIEAGLGKTVKNPEKYGQFMETNEGSEVTVMNIGVQPPTRKVGISASPMRLERNVPIGDFYDAISDEGLSYEKSAREIDTAIVAISTIAEKQNNILNTIEGDSTIEGAEEAGLGGMGDVETQDIADVKIEIESKLGLPKGVTLDTLASMDGKTLSTRSDIKTFVEFANLGALLGKLKDEKDTKRLSYKKALREKSQDVSKSLESGDALARDVIQTFYGLGIDISWTEINQLLDNTQVQTHLQSVMGNDFSLQHIDLANGKFGQSGMSEDSMTILHENLAKFANIIYFGEPEPNDSPINTADFGRYSQGKVPTPTSEIMALREQRGLLVAGSVNRVLLEQRLSGKK